MFLNCVKYALFITLVLGPSIPARADVDSRFLIEFVAGEGLSYNSYSYRDLSLEAREFPEFTHELGADFYLYALFDWFGLGGGLGILYNLNGASSEYTDDPTIKYMFHWIKVPLLLSLSLNRGTAIAHLDGGVYTSLFLAGNREWENEERHESRTGTLSAADISPDFGVRIQFCMDMEMLSLNEEKTAVGLGMGIFLEKSLTDITKEHDEEFYAFRLGILGIISLFPKELRK